MRILDCIAFPVIPDDHSKEYFIEDEPVIVVLAPRSHQLELRNNLEAIGVEDSKVVLDFFEIGNLWVEAVELVLVVVLILFLILAEGSRDIQHHKRPQNISGLNFLDQFGQRVSGCQSLMSLEYHHK